MLTPPAVMTFPAVDQGIYHHPIAQGKAGNTFTGLGNFGGKFMSQDHRSPLPTGEGMGPGRNNERAVPEFMEV